MLRDKFGVHVEDTIDFGPIPANQRVTKSIPIQNYDQNGRSVTLTGLDFQVTSPPIYVPDNTFPIILPAKKSVCINVFCQSGDFGATQIFTLIHLENDKGIRSKIGTIIKLEIRDELLDQMQGNMKPFVPRFQPYYQKQAKAQHVIKAPKKKTNLFVKKRLGFYPIPKNVEEAYYKDDNDLIDTFPVLGQALTMANYKEKFAKLIYLEELENTEIMNQYSLCSVSFQRHGQYLSLEVPGLAEKRPSLALGDVAIIRQYNRQEAFEGSIRDILSSSVLIEFDSRFHQAYCGELYDVEFQFSRRQFRQMHQAIEEVYKHFGQQVLFPSKVTAGAAQVQFTIEQARPVLQHSYFHMKNHPKIVKLPSTKKEGKSTTEWRTPYAPNFKRRGNVISKPLEHEFKVKKPYVPKEYLSNFKGGQLVLSWVNKDLNPEQKNAVTRILSGQARPLPYVIYGPPGTGKTVTVVETILQVFKLRSDSRILIVTPSNSAADLIAERLHASNQIKIGDMARLNAWQRNPDAIPDIIKPYSFVNEELAVLGKVVRHRIVIATCSTSGQLYQLGLSEGHFTHCVIDEAGETTEPESMIPIGLLASSASSQIVLAGDPKQLGPVLQSPEAKMYGFGVSFLERLSMTKLYRRNESKFQDHGNYDPMLVTKLIRNYRSHACVLKVPSQLFYEAELMAEATNEIQKRFLHLKILPNPDQPLIFHGVRGPNFQEGDSPSWFNPTEALQVSHYIRELLNEGVDPADVGIIAPYRQQIAKLRQILRSLELPVPKIGSVEEFQGQERPIIIVTTVRSQDHQSHVKADASRGLGFLQCEKRFNVAITRAMSLLIVIGDPHLLAEDHSWKEFLKHCIDLKAYKGCDLPIALTLNNQTE